MKTIFTASRIKDCTLAYSVLLRTASSGSVDVSIWLSDEEARKLGQQLLAASEPNIPATTTEAA